jgi:hypothetical protein
MTTRSKGFLAGLLLGVVLLISFVGFQYLTYSSCSCGFRYDPFTGSCVVDINAGPCGQGGGPSPGNPGTPGTGSGSPGSVWAPQVSTPAGSCGIYSYACGPTADWRALTFNVAWGGTTGSPSAPGPKAMVQASLRDSAGKSCAAMKGVVVAPGNNPATVTIPVDGSAVSTYPDLQVTTNDSCRAVQFSVASAPLDHPECGCKVTVKRD